MLAKVNLSASAHMLCSTYAYSTEVEEVALLLCGQFSVEEAQTVAIVETCIFMIRKDKQKYRVEISSEKLSEAIIEAENMGMQVIGWCHSHPKITVWPSHIDLATQASFQTMDKNFFGLIYSVFHETSDGNQRLQVTAFQASNDSPPSHVKIPIFIVPCTLNTRELHKLGQITEKLLEEEREVHSYSIARDNICGCRIAQLQDKIHLPLIKYFSKRIND